MANRKKSEMLEAIAPDVRAAIEKNDIDYLARKSKTMQIEGEQPYNKDIYIHEVNFFLKSSAKNIIEAGKRLLVIKEKEGYGNFDKVLEEEIGIARRTAYRFMNIAIKSEKYPTIELCQLGTTSNVYALMEAPDEDLKELEEKGVMAGNTMDDLQRMSVKEMRELIKKLKTDTDKIIKEEVKNIEVEKKALIKELNRLKVFDPEAKTAPTWVVDQMEEVERQINEVDDTLRKFVFDPKVLEHPDIQAKVEAIQRRLEKRLELFVGNWDAFVNEGEE